MNDQTTKLPNSFWVTSVLALIWNALGVMNFVGQTFMSAETLAAMPEEQQALFESVPAWITVVFGIAVITGTLGSIALLLKKAWAVPLFLISLITILIQMLHGLFLTDMTKVMGTPAIVTTFMVIIIAIFLYWYAKKCEKRAWIT